MRSVSFTSELNSTSVQNDCLDDFVYKTRRISEMRIWCGCSVWCNVGLSVKIARHGSVLDVRTGKSEEHDAVL